MACPSVTAVVGGPVAGGVVPTAEPMVEEGTAEGDAVETPAEDTNAVDDPADGGTIAADDTATDTDSNTTDDTTADTDSNTTDTDSNADTAATADPEIQITDDPQHVIAFVRDDGDDRLLVVINFGEIPATVSLPTAVGDTDLRTGEPLPQRPDPRSEHTGHCIVLDDLVVCRPPAT